MPGELGRSAYRVVQYSQARAESLAESMLPKPQSTRSSQLQATELRGRGLSVKAFAKRFGGDDRAAETLRWFRQRCGGLELNRVMGHR